VATDVNKNIRNLLLQEYLATAKRMWPLFVLLGGALFFILGSFITVGETRYVTATVAHFSQMPGSTDGVEYLVMETEDGKSVSVDLLGKPKVGDEYTLRLAFFSPVYKIHVASIEE